METLHQFATRCRTILDSDTFTPDAPVSVVYAGRPGVDYGSGPGKILASARGGRLMLFTDGYPSSEDEDGNEIGYAHAVLYVWPAEWPSLPYLMEAVGKGRTVTLHGADPEDQTRPLLEGEPSDLYIDGIAPPPSAEDLTSQDVYVPLDVIRILAREERAMEAAMRTGTREDRWAAAARVQVARDELIRRLIPSTVRSLLDPDPERSPTYAEKRRALRQEMFGRGPADRNGVS